MSVLGLMVARHDVEHSAFGVSAASRDSAGPAPAARRYTLSIPAMTISIEIALATRVPLLLGGENWG